MKDTKVSSSQAPTSSRNQSTNVYSTDILTDGVDSDWFLFQLNENSNVLQECLDIVASYIKEHELLIVGGMSIDFGLRVQGDKLYNEFTIPDYDIVSPDNLDHAKRVGELLCEMGVKDVAVVPAIHKTTMRVQLLGYTLFDATFVPHSVYSKIPFLNYEGFKFVDPVYQKIDQYSSLALLWDITGPSFNILNRLKKDIERKEMLNKYYRLQQYAMPSKLTDNSENKSHTWESPYGSQIKFIQFDNTNDESLENIYTKTYCADCNWVYHGKLAYAIYYYIFTSQLKPSEKITVRPLIKNNNGKIMFEYWGNCIEVVSHGKDINQKSTLLIKDKYNNVEIKKYTKLVTAYQSTIEVYTDNTKIKMFDLSGHNLSINQTKIEDTCVIFTNVNYVLSYFLFMHFYSDSNYDKELYGAYYTSLLAMVEESDKLNIEQNEANPFTISMNVMGMKYWVDENYDFFIKNYRNVLEFKHNLTTVPPKNYLKYPNCEAKKEFNKKDSEYYAEACEHTEHTNFMETNQFI